MLLCVHCVCTTCAWINRGGFFCGGGGGEGDFWPPSQNFWHFVSAPFMRYLQHMHVAHQVCTVSPDDAWVKNTDMYM